MKLCHNCPDRRQGCHAVCEDYLAYRAKKDEALKKRREDNMISSVKIESCIKTQNRWRRGHQ